MEAVLQFLYGGLTVMCGVIGFVFLRYWYVQRDRLYLFFMAAFWALAAGWGVHLYARSSETGAHVYLFRLVGFLLIIAAIIDKNRRAARTSATG
jgi:hypothetical protein